nr:uncharacterized protein LOC124819280 [Hydra vulgaris]
MKKTEQLQCLDIPIKALSPLPVRTSLLKRKKNNSNTTVLTSSPYKDALSGRALLRPNKKIKQDRQCLKECEQANKSLQNKSWFCYLCEENIKKSIQCLTCQGWSHNDCAGVNQKQKRYICNFCQE